MLKKLASNVDILCGCGATAWAVAGVYLPDLASLCDPRIAFSFALAAFGRGYISLKG